MTEELIELTKTQKKIPAFKQAEYLRYLQQTYTDYRWVTCIDARSGVWYIGYEGEPNDEFDEYFDVFGGYYNLDIRRIV